MLLMTFITEKKQGWVEWFNIKSPVQMLVSKC